jgi:hypothetical protein
VHKAFGAIHAPHLKPIELADPLVKYGPTTESDSTTKTRPTAIYVDVPTLPPHLHKASFDDHGALESIIPLPPTDVEPETETPTATAKAKITDKGWITQDPLQAPLFPLTSASATADDTIPWTTKGTWTTKGIAAKVTPMNPPTVSSPAITGSELTLQQPDQGNM